MSTNGSSHNKRVLIVEDRERTLGWLIRMMRRNETLTVDLAHNSDEAVEELLNHEYNLIILDWRLGDGSNVQDTGGVILERLANDATLSLNCKVPVIIVTADISSADIRGGSFYPNVISVVSKLRLGEVRESIRTVIDIALDPFSEP